MLGMKGTNDNGLCKACKLGCMQTSIKSLKIMSCHSVAKHVAGHTGVNLKMKE
jgi:hypothetical protein